MSASHGNYFLYIQIKTKLRYSYYYYIGCRNTIFYLERRNVIFYPLYAFKKARVVLRIKPKPPYIKFRLYAKCIIESNALNFK